MRERVMGGTMPLIDVTVEHTPEYKVALVCLLALVALWLA